MDKSKIKKIVLAYSGGLDTCLLYTSIRGLSKTALENAMQILRALEREHQRVFSAALTSGRSTGARI